MIGSEKSPATAYHMIAKELLINLAINMLPRNQITDHFLIRILFSQRLSTITSIFYGCTDQTLKYGCLSTCNQHII